MSRSRAVALMVLVTLMWSMAGVVTKRLDGAASFEVTFWRSAFTVLSMLGILALWQGPKRLVHHVTTGGWPLAISSVCWTIMFTAFMVALTLTTVANVLITMALGPLFTALLASFTLGQRLPLRTWAAIVAAGLGIVWIVLSSQSGASDQVARMGQPWLGMAVAVCVPLAGAVNWTLLQSLNLRQAHRASMATGAGAPSAAAPDLTLAVLGGALGSSLLTLPLAWPFTASMHDIGWLALLGLAQLAIPCALAVVIARHLSAPEMSLLALLEVVFGVAWAWWGAGETPGGGVLAGGALVIGALVANEGLALREKPQG
jgi:drug/metabolite transporter (DMT)-like permease